MNSKWEITPWARFILLFEILIHATMRLELMEGKNHQIRVLFRSLFSELIPEMRVGARVTL